MTPEELNSYRFTSYDDPTDEMLEAIMHEAGEEVRHNNAIIKENFERNLTEVINSAFAAQ